MTSFNGKAIVYDSLGNPKTYDGNTYTWEGRQLKSISNANGKTEFTYDADGLRTQTRVLDINGGLVQFDEYYWKDGVLDSHKLIVPGKVEVAKILYDSEKQPRGYILNNEETVLFVKNLQGDVAALVNASGEYLVEFYYDAWGNMKYYPYDITHAEAERYIKLCPITYRGYNYDFTTGLYYLQSRYYNPEWGRFLNCDDTNILLATQGEILGANLFAYCNNDPVNRVDYFGEDSTGYEWIGDMVIGLCCIIILEKIGGYSDLLSYEIFDIIICNKNEMTYANLAFYNKSNKKYYILKMTISKLGYWKSRKENLKSEILDFSTDIAAGYFEGSIEEYIDGEKEALMHLLGDTINYTIGLAICGTIHYIPVQYYSIMRKNDGRKMVIALTRVQKTRSKVLMESQFKTLDKPLLYNRIEVLDY